MGENNRKKIKRKKIMSINQFRFMLGKLTM